MFLFCDGICDIVCKILLTIAVILLLHYVYLLSNKNYWINRGVFSPNSGSLMGNLPGQVNGKRNVLYDLDDLYQKYKPSHSCIGIFNFRSPRLLIFDPEIARDVLIKHFKSFQATEFYGNIDITADPLFGEHMFFLVGEAWKTKRQEVSPAFTASRVSDINRINFDGD